MVPSTQKAWSVTKGKGGPKETLALDSSAAVPSIGEHDVLVKISGASLNYRDLIIPKGQYPFPTNLPIVPLSDGAGTVVATGSRVTRFKEGDKVVTLFNQAHLSGAPDAAAMSSGVGGMVPGAAQQYASFNEHGLVHAPANLDGVAASTLTCAGLTAWNALYGLKPLLPGDWVLTQGTGGVSVFAVQFAKAAGARVIATTSSAAKGERLKALGADHVINYVEDQEWGKTAKKITGGLGVAHVIEVGGPNTMKNSLEAVRFEGVISVIGFLAGVKGEKQPSMIDALMHVCIIRGIYVGSRAQMEDMVRAIEANDIKPVVDEKVFALEQLPEAYEYMDGKKHFGKICVRID